MEKQSFLCLATILLASLAGFPNSLAQCGPGESFDELRSGIRTDCLTPKQIRIWEQIESIAEASDGAGRPAHPRLNSLWEWAKGNGHSVFIRMAEKRSVPTGTGGRAILMEQHHGGCRREVIVWLHLWAIDNALIDETVRRADGLIPYHSLGRYERYAEVVGHELAHAFLLLEKPEYAQRYSELNTLAAECVRLRKGGSGAGVDENLMRQYQIRLQSLIDMIEKPAETAETEIWRELASGHRRRPPAGVGSETGEVAVLADFLR